MRILFAVRLYLAALLLALGLVTPRSVSADVLELLSGASIEGQVASIDKTRREVTFSRQVGSRSYSRVYTYDKIHAVTMNGQRYVLNPLPAGAAPPAAPARASAAARSAATGDSRTQEEVEALIEQLGRQPPDWYEATPLDYPKTLDLSWPERPPGAWNSQKNVGQYIWDVINPNSNRWREGIRLMHHLLQLHQDDPAMRTRVMQSMGKMYHDFEEDYARAAFWWRKAGLDSSRSSAVSVNLARCYWKLGSKRMAEQLLGRLPVYSTSIKLWADMGETAKALQLVEAYARAGYQDIAYLYGGDACRIQGKYDEAVAYYERVLKVSASGQAAKRIQKNQARARENIQAIQIFDALDLTQVKDGTYTGRSMGYAGQLQVQVTVRGGRIEAVAVTEHQEKQFYAALTDTPKQIIAAQGLKGIDAVSGATITSEAIINAAAKALGSAR
jgi:uncharacterized protein with FMN-binding domain